MFLKSRRVDELLEFVMCNIVTPSTVILICHPTDGRDEGLKDIKNILKEEYDTTLSISHINTEKGNPKVCIFPDERKSPIIMISYENIQPYANRNNRKVYDIMGGVDQCFYVMNTFTMC